MGEGIVRMGRGLLVVVSVAEKKALGKNISHTNFVSMYVSYYERKSPVAADGVARLAKVSVP